VSDKPNILIFMTDHQRGDTVLGEHPCKTPNLDRFAADSVTFTETHCPAPHCCPARATFMSGLYPTRTGIWNNVNNGQSLGSELKDGVRLFSEDLADAGYKLAYSGKWHVSAFSRPDKFGWEILHGGGVGFEDIRERWDFYRKLAEKPEPAERGEGGILRPGYPHYVTYKSTGEQGNGHDEGAVAAAVEALPDLAGSGDPWCLFVGCIMPHDPYNVPQKYLDLYDVDGIPLPPSYADTLADKPRLYQRMRNMRWGQLTEREVREAVRHFWAYCTYLDDLFGQVLAALDATGQADDTLVLYCSDHGDYCGDHGLFCKGIPAFRGAYHVPAVVRWPAGNIQPGRRVDEFVSLADFAPTFTELAGKAPDTALSGRSLLPLLRGETPPDWRDDMNYQCNGVELYYTQRTVLTKDWKYVFNGFDFDELYDLRNDPHEMTNLADDPAQEEVKRDMCRRMWRFAHRELDTMINGYITVALAPWGPADAFRQP